MQARNNLVGIFHEFFLAFDSRNTNTIPTERKGSVPGSEFLETGFRTGRTINSVDFLEHIWDLNHGRSLSLQRTTSSSYS